VKSFRVSGKVKTGAVVNLFFNSQKLLSQAFIQLNF
jgi:hypothetical protein